MVSASIDARVGLLGNPGDGYGGRVLAFTIADMAATVHATAAPQWDVGDGDEAALFSAVVAKLDVAQPAQLRLETTIPRQVGLSGSSAIVLATMLAILELNQQTMAPVALARLALQAETEGLGITAGPQDRVVQTFGGFMDMDFATDWDATGYHRLDPALVPSDLFIAWDLAAGESSGALHRPVRDAWEAGDPAVREAIGRFRLLAVAGWTALVGNDRTTLANLLDTSFETRAQLWDIAASDRHKIELARSNGAAAKFCGSGGAVVGVPRNKGSIDALATAYENAGYGFLVPTLGAPRT